MMTLRRDELEGIAKETLEASPLIVECDTCGKVFLLMSCYEFMSKTRMWIANPDAGPDRWAVHALLHWMEDHSHEVMFKWPGLPPNSVSYVWRNLWDEQGVFVPEKVQRYVEETRQLAI